MVSYPDPFPPLLYPSSITSVLLYNIEITSQSCLIQYYLDLSIYDRASILMYSCLYAIFVRYPRSHVCVRPMYGLIDRKRMACLEKVTTTYKEKGTFRNEI